MTVLVVRQTVWRRHKPIGNGNYAAVAAAAAAEAAKLLLFDSINGKTTWWNARRIKMLRIIKWNRKHAHTQERERRDVVSENEWFSNRLSNALDAVPNEVLRIHQPFTFVVQLCVAAWVTELGVGVVYACCWMCCKRCHNYDEKM